MKFFRWLRGVSFKRLFGMDGSTEARAKFVDLAPTSKADEDGIYAEALEFATTNPDVSNIALTGPYGSGKSSVIKSFLRTYRGNALQISLAAFLPEADGMGGSNGKTNKQEIERSILQQMLYGASANNLPLSRFKRIQSPKWWAGGVSLLIVLGGIALWYLFQNREDIISGEFFTPFDRSNWFNLGVFAFGFVFLWRSLHHIYLKSFGMSLKGVSLKDVEIAPESAEEESILNRHLDEIIYFFQSTSYDLVVVEDLDRFENPDIFVTLREINGLINANAGVKQQVRFLYALRDDMFANTDRTKFFEFIVPIVPIINHSNSIDKVLEQGQRLSLDERLNAQFLRDVSRYLNDLRLIRNIFNEYAIYVANLEADEEEVLNPNKLLAVLIYKNVLPRDFEELHQQKGVLSALLARYDDFIAKVEADYKSQIGDVETEITLAKKQLPKDVTELRKIYAMALIELLPAGHGYIRLGNTNITFDKISEHTDFERILSENPILSAQHPNGGWSRTQNPGVDRTVDTNRSFQERLGDIERKSVKQIAQSGQKVRELKSKVTNLRLQKFNEIIRANADAVDDCFEKLGDNRELMKFLVFEGFLDDTYYQYTSLFHSGRLSPNDNKFLIQIRSFNTPDPDFPIDNPAEVVAAMRDEDFDQSYVLNRRLMDHIMEAPITHSSRIEKAVRYISENFDQCEQFFSSYYERGTQVPALVSTLVSQWPGFASLAAESAHSTAHVARIIAYAPQEVIANPPYAEGDLSASFSIGAAEILGEGIEFDLSRLKLLQVQVAELSSVDQFPDVLEFLIDEALYQVSTENIRCVLEHTHGSDIVSYLETKHYSTVLRSENKGLIQRVEDDFIRYVRRVLLPMESNSNEEEFAILAALNHEEVAAEFLEEFWSMQSTSLPVLSDVPLHLHATALARDLISASWENCLTFLSGDNFDPDILTAYLANPDTQKFLTNEAIPEDKSAYDLRRFIIDNDSFDSGTYRAYVRRLPKKFKDFRADLNKDKLRILIEEGKATFSGANFNRLGEYRDLQVLFVARNFPAFAKEADGIGIDDEFRMDLLQEDLSEDQKRSVIAELNPAAVSEDAARAASLGTILTALPSDIEGLGFDLIKAIAIHSHPVTEQISLLNKCHKSLSVEEVREVLRALPEPYSDIAIFGKSPRIKNTPVNRAFAAWLEEKRVISSSKTTYLEREIKVNTFRGQRVETTG
ncbi:YobI family P-loop NTPase [Leisingera sp. NJS204]|uniref:YobI family P-loop NTPase n=1 Tax=Leisingera sp. NJS204 TaxID=2508307 RepID=UPI00101040BD|nr:ATP-binding protein [Leisingera sp. NJS204]QAX28315.1 ATP-binding protein [Leisingera sp. NJS204]